MMTFLSGLFEPSETLSLERLIMAPAATGGAPMTATELRHVLDLMPSDIEFAELSNGMSDQELEAVLAKMTGC
jgi:hypothetical protein